MSPKIAIPQDEINVFCQRNHIRKLSLFGSVLRDSFNPDSDVDFLVEFEPDYIPGFIALSKMRLELSDLLGRQVDLLTAQSLSRYFREDVVANAQRIYSAN